MVSLPGKLVEDATYDNDNVKWLCMLGSRYLKSISKVSFSTLYIGRKFQSYVFSSFVSVHMKSPGESSTHVGGTIMTFNDIRFALLTYARFYPILSNCQHPYTD